MLQNRLSIDDDPVLILQVCEERVASSLWKKVRRQRAFCCSVGAAIFLPVHLGFMSKFECNKPSSFLLHPVTACYGRPYSCNQARFLSLASAAVAKHPHPLCMAVIKGTSHLTWKILPCHETDVCCSRPYFLCICSSKWDVESLAPKSRVGRPQTFDVVILKQYADLRTSKCCY